MIPHLEAREHMLEFVRENLGFAQDGDYFSKDDLVLRVASTKIKPSKKFIDEVKANAKDGVATALLMLRSTTQYQGGMLRPLVYLENGKNYFWQNEKNFTKFELDVRELYGNRLAYFNPQLNAIQLIRTRRFRHVPDLLADMTEQELAENKQLRQQLHIEEGRREAFRKISIYQTIGGAFTVAPYDRATKPLVGLIEDANQPMLIP